MSAPKKSFGPPPPPPPSLKYVSGAPGDWVEPHQGIVELNWVELYCFGEAVTYFTNY